MARRTNTQRLADKIREGQRRATRTPCPTCGRPTWRGLDGDVLATTATAEAWAARPADEVLAAATGRAAYVLRTVAGGHELDARTPDHALHHPGRSTYGGRVHLAHHCDDPARPEPTEQAALWAADDPTPPPY